MLDYRKSFSFLGKRVHLEIAKNIKHAGFYYTNSSYNDERQIYLGIYYQFYLSFDGYTGRLQPKKYGIDIDTNGICLYYGFNDYFGDAKGCKKKMFWWNRVPRFLFGKEVRLWGHETHHPDLTLSMDYGDTYRVKISSKQLYLWRPRWFGKKLWLSYTLTPDRPIPFQGKGENSWDQGPDGTSEMSTSADSPEDALKKLKLGCERDRKKYGMVKNIQIRPFLTPKN